MGLYPDGNLNTQRQKIKALRLDRFFKKSIPTYQYGLRYSKPSTYVFQKICNWEKIVNIRYSMYYLPQYLLLLQHILSLFSFYNLHLNYEF